MFGVTKEWHGFNVVNNETGELVINFPRVYGVDNYERAQAYASELTTREQRAREYR